MRQSDCTRNCWSVGAIWGLVVMLFASGLGQTHWLGGLFLGLITFALSGGFLVWLVCDGRAPGYDLTTGLRNPRQEPALPAEPVALVAPKTRAPASDAIGATTLTEAAETPLKNKDKGEKPKSKTKPGKKAKPDDLKQIDGIGPKMEVRLNELGVTRFDEIALWGPDEIADYAQKLGRRGGRITADDWVGQARALSGGGNG